MTSLEYAVDDRVIAKVAKPAATKKQIYPCRLCRNVKTGEVEVTENFFNIVWDDHKTDESWNAWTFVHESNYFQWGSPLDQAKKPNPATGQFDDIVEISVLCARGCGRLLMEHALEWVAHNTTYRWCVLNSTKGAESWYLRQGFKHVTAYRLPWKSASKKHLYRHRIPDDLIDPKLDPPSIMMYKPIVRSSPLSTKIDPLAIPKPLPSPVSSSMPTLRSSKRSNNAPIPTENPVPSKRRRMSRGNAPTEGSH